MFLSEQEMKKTILKDIKSLESYLTKSFDIEKFGCLKFVGEEIEMSTGRCDLLFAACRNVRTSGSESFSTLGYFVIVELKNRIGTCEDLGQISRYINGLRMQLSNCELVDDFKIKGVLLSLGFNENVKQLEAADVLNNIILIDAQPCVAFLKSGFNYSNQVSDNAKLSDLVFDYISSSMEVTKDATG